MPLRFTNVATSCLFLISVILVIIAIGFRPETVGSDTFTYSNYYQQLLLNTTDNFRYDYLFEIVACFFISLGLSVEYFFTSFALINFMCLILLARNLSVYFVNQVSFYRIFFLLISLLCISPFFLSAQVNVLRQGTAICILFLYYVLLLERAHLLLILMIVLLAQGFHHTTVLYVFFSPLVYFKYLSVLRSMIFMAILYTSGVIQYLLHWFALGLYNKIINYGSYSGYSGYQLGTRYEFVAFTLGIGFLFHWMGKYFLSNLWQKKFYDLLKIYWILTLPFYIFGFGTYSDRYLLPAWIFISILGTAFTLLALKKLDLSIYWYYVVFLLSTSYFLLKAQGIIG